MLNNLNFRLHSYVLAEIDYNDVKMTDRYSESYHSHDN